MQKWEYLTVTRRDSKGIYYPHLVNGQELRNWNVGANLYDYLNHLGDQGWELVASTSLSGWTEGFILKRPKP